MYKATFPYLHQHQQVNDKTSHTFTVVFVRIVTTVVYVITQRPPAHACSLILTRPQPVV